MAGLDELGIRPTTGKVRAALFNILYSRLLDFEGLVFLDMCAGTGQIGLEALKRGFTAVDFVDRDRRITAQLKQKITQPKCTIYTADAQKFNANKTYDVVFADPPYDEAASLFVSIYEFAMNNLSAEGIFVYEAGSVLVPPVTPSTKKIYGKTALYIYDLGVTSVTAT